MTLCLGGQYTFYFVLLFIDLDAPSKLKPLFLPIIAYRQPNSSKISTRYNYIKSILNRILDTPPSYSLEMKHKMATQEVELPVCKSWRTGAKVWDRKQYGVFMRG
jgi:hypothetical protein